MTREKRKNLVKSQEEPTSKSQRTSDQLFNGNFCLRFPQLAESIFDSVDNLSLVRCREIDRNWNNFLTAPKFLLIRKIFKKFENHHKKSWKCTEIWMYFTKNLQTSDVLQLELACSKFCSENSKNYGSELHCNAEHYSSELDSEDQDLPSWNLYCITPIHIAAGTGNLVLLKTLVRKVNKIQAKDDYRRTPLHYAAMHGHLETCQFIMQKINDKNPRGWFLQDIYRRTPLYFAAENGHLAICKLIMEHINTNPRHTSVEDEYKQVTFQIAAEHGHLEVCQWIIEIIDDKNPPNINGTTPLHFAAEIGHLAICKLILEHIVAIKILEMIIMIPQPMAARHFIWLQRMVILMFAH